MRIYFFLVVVVLLCFPSVAFLIMKREPERVGERFFTLTEIDLRWVCLDSPGLSESVRALFVSLLLSAVQYFHCAQEHGYNTNHRSMQK